MSKIYYEVSIKILIYLNGIFGVVMGLLSDFYNHNMDTICDKNIEKCTTAFMFMMLFQLLMSGNAMIYVKEYLSSFKRCMVCIYIVISFFGECVLLFLLFWSYHIYQNVHNDCQSDLHNNRYKLLNIYMIAISIFWIISRPLFFILLKKLGQYEKVERQPLLSDLV